MRYWRALFPWLRKGRPVRISTHLSPDVFFEFEGDATLADVERLVNRFYEVATPSTPVVKFAWGPTTEQPLPPPTP